MTILYNEATKKLLTAFGNLFSNISVHRETSNGYRLVKLPIHFAPGSYEHVDILQHPDLLELRPSITLPLLTYEITRREVDVTRKENRFYTKTSCIANENGTFDVIRSPTPFLIGMNLYLWSHYLDDMYELQEKIFTGFNPKITVRIKQDNGIITQVPISFQSVSTVDNYEGSPHEKSRLIQTTFSFEAKMDFYRTTGENADVIRTISLNYEKPTNKDEIEFKQIISVDPIDADITDNWTVKKEIISDTTVYNDGEKAVLSQSGFNILTQDGNNLTIGTTLFEDNSISSEINTQKGFDILTQSSDKLITQ